MDHSFAGFSPSGLGCFGPVVKQHIKVGAHGRAKPHVMTMIRDRKGKSKRLGPTIPFWDTPPVIQRLSTRLHLLVHLEHLASLYPSRIKALSTFIFSEYSLLLLVLIDSRLLYLIFPHFRRLEVSVINAQANFLPYCKPLLFCGSFHCVKLDSVLHFLLLLLKCISHQELIVCNLKIFLGWSWVHFVQCYILNACCST